MLHVMNENDTESSRLEASKSCSIFHIKNFDVFLKSNGMCKKEKQLAAKKWKLEGMVSGRES